MCALTALHEVCAELKTCTRHLKYQENKKDTTVKQRLNLPQIQRKTESNNISQETKNYPKNFGAG